MKWPATISLNRASEHISEQVNGSTMGEPLCRACGGVSGRMVLDLGEQPASDYFPPSDDPGPDPCYPLQMWLCSACSLAQLIADSTVPEEPKGVEPHALIAQARDAVERVEQAGWLDNKGRVMEFGSPHGGSWLQMMADRGLAVVDEDAEADVVVDSFGIMHEPNQAQALARRDARIAPGGVLLLLYHSLSAILHHGQWNVLRHGHYAYYSTLAMTTMLKHQGFAPRMGWSFDLYGGTVLLAATRIGDATVALDASVHELIDADLDVGVNDPDALGALQIAAEARAQGLRNWLASERDSGHRVLGYGAASRAVALLCRAGIDRSLLPAVVDVSAAKQGRRMPGTDIPIIGPSELARQRPSSVLIFLSDLLPEVREQYHDIEGSGGKWVDVETVGAP